MLFILSQVITKLCNGDFSFNSNTLHNVIVHCMSLVDILNSAFNLDIFSVNITNIVFYAYLLPHA